MNVYVINMKEAVERRASIESQLQSLGIKANIVEAVSGKALSDEELAEKVDMAEVSKHPEWLTKGVLGCALSHQEVYKQIVESGSTWNLILEDDVILNTDVEMILDHIVKQKETFKNHVTLLYTISHNRYGPVILSSDRQNKVGTYGIHKVLGQSPAGAGAYIMHKDVAKKILEKNKTIKVAPDTWNYFLAQGVFSQINCIYPFAARPGFFESTIGYVRYGSILYRAKRFINKYKLPPLYSLLKWNRKRVWEKTSSIVFL